MTGMIVLTEPKLPVNAKLANQVILGSPSQPVQLLDITKRLVRSLIARRAQPPYSMGRWS